VTPAARLQAAIEILDGLAARPPRQPAEQVVNDYLRQRRYIGSKDRRALTAMTFDLLRHRARIAWRLRSAQGEAEAPRQQLLAYLLACEKQDPGELEKLFDGSRYAPPPLSAEEAALVGRLAAGQAAPPPAWVAHEVPEWLTPKLEAAFGPDWNAESAALLQEAPVDLRVNTLLGSRDAARAALAEEDIETLPTPLSPLGLRVEGRRALRGSTAFTSGLVELQDEGSQLVALLCDARPGMTVADVCAGAAGKTLALAAAMGGKGRLLAMDSQQARLDRAALRVKRADAGFIERRTVKDLTAEDDLQAACDRVLVDAPCSGIGAWRRHPDARWRLTPEDLEGYKAAQRGILAAAARLVKPGGRLIYVTCSLLPEENAEQAEAFLAAAPDFAALPAAAVWREVLGDGIDGGDPWLTLTPARHGTDGFFVAIFQKKETA
jgi:16S rRNA (cytosine967-C5)-methyltransferase